MISLKFVKNLIFSNGFFGPKLCSKLKISRQHWVGNRLSFSLHYRKSRLSHFFTEKIAILYGRFFPRKLQKFTKSATLNVRHWEYLEPEKAPIFQKMGINCKYFSLHRLKYLQFAEKHEETVTFFPKPKRIWLYKRGSVACFVS